MKDLNKIIIKRAKQEGFNTVRNSIFRLMGDVYYMVSFLFIKDNMRFDISVKKSVYDDIFWDVLGLDRTELKLSTRIHGAFSSPTVELYSGSMIIQTEDDINCFFNQIDEIKKKSSQIVRGISDYVINDYVGIDSEIIKCLEYLNRKEYGKALEIATKQVMMGDHGRFVVGNKGFFDRIIELYS